MNQSAVDSTYFAENPHRTYYVRPTFPGEIIGSLPATKPYVAVRRFKTQTGHVPVCSYAETESDAERLWWSEWLGVCEVEAAALPEETPYF